MNSIIPYFTYATGIFCCCIQCYISDASKCILCDCMIMACFSREIPYAYWKQMECLPKSVYFSCSIKKHENTVYWYYVTLQDIGVSMEPCQKQFRNYWPRESYTIRFVTFKLKLQLTYTNLSLLYLHITSLLTTKFKHRTVTSECLSALWRIRQLELQ